MKRSFLYLASCASLLTSAATAKPNKAWKDTNLHPVQLFDLEADPAEKIIWQKNTQM